MFAINGPSGPTSRGERRAVTDDERKQLAKAKSERFSDERTVATAAAVAAAPPAGSSSKSRTKSAESTGALIFKVTNARVMNSVAKGCRIVFNGRTGGISSYYLAKFVQDHGGSVCSAMATTRVTHMVGANLSGSKADNAIKRLAASKVKIVSPDWILQSVKHKKRMSEFEFLLYKDTQQRRLG